jgi:hypothetical protein
LKDIDVACRKEKVLEIGEMVAFIGLVGLGPASRVFTFLLLDRLLFSNNPSIKCRAWIVLTIWRCKTPTLTEPSLIGVKPNGHHGKLRGQC